MLTFAVMLLGVLAGRFFPAAHKSKNEKLQLACTLALIFAMGVSLGGGGRFFASLAFIGGQSFLFCLVPTIGSIAAVYPLTVRFMDGGRTETAADDPGRLAPKTKDPMVFLALGALLGGIACGAYPRPPGSSRPSPTIPKRCSISSWPPWASAWASAGASSPSSATTT